MSKVAVEVTDIVAIREDGTGIALRTPHPDRLEYTIMPWDVVDSIRKAWNGHSTMDWHPKDSLYAIRFSPQKVTELLGIAAAHIDTL